MVAVPTLTVVPARQVNTDGSAVTLHEAIGTLINVCLTSLPSEPLLTDTGVRVYTGSSVLAQTITQSSADCPVAYIAWFTGAAVAPHRVETDGILITAVKTCRTLITLCAGIVIDPDVSSVADAHEGSWSIDTHGVLSAVVLSLSTLINISTVRAVIPQGAVAIFTAAAGPSLQVHTF